MQSLSFLLSCEAANARMVVRKPRFVVHLEVSSGMDRDTPRFEELDADSAEHAELIGSSWKQNGMCISFAVRRVMHSGELHRPCVIR